MADYKSMYNTLAGAVDRALACLQKSAARCEEIFESSDHNEPIRLPDREDP